jgi:uncharacterized protein
MAKFEAYEDQDGRWRWRLWSEGGRIVASSGEAYASQRGALHAAGLVRDASAGAALASEPGLGIRAAVRLKALLDDSPPLDTPPPAAAASPARVSRRRLRAVAGGPRPASRRPARGEPLRAVRP